MRSRRRSERPITISRSITASSPPSPTFRRGRSAAPERIRERLREKEVIRRRLARLVEACEAVRASIKETIRVFNGKPGDPRSFDLLDRLLDDQAYRLAYWRVAAEEINYRRFFDINELAAIRMENPAVFRETHRLILRLVAEGKVTGIRLDHPDGLFDPPAYFRALQRERALQALQAAPASAETEPASDRPTAMIQAGEAFDRHCRPDPSQPGCRPLYLLAEKILAKGERLPSHWAIHGTTGYEFLNAVDGLFVEAANERAMTAAYVAFTGQRTPYTDLAYESKQLIMQVSMSSELNVLGHALDRLSERNRHSRDFTLNSLTHALREVITCFPVYRTYIDGRSPEVSLQDRACVEVAVAFAKRRNLTTNVSVFDFVRDTLLLRYPENADATYKQDQLAFVQKFQQLTAPITAKGVEDTASYRYHRLVSLNEVGGAPDRFGISVEDFHQQCLARQEKWPASMSASSTHDTKRSEDVRAHIHVLSEIPRVWRQAVTRWHRWNRRHLAEVEGRPAPDRNDEYLLYQTLVGAWPLLPPGPDEAAAFIARIQQYMLKAAKEAKLNTSWINPHEAYDEALTRFVAGILAPGRGNRFLADFVAFHPGIARLGMVNSLALTLLKIVAPGVPDFYQGTEIWDFSLVDPDNRRPVDLRRPGGAPDRPAGANRGGRSGRLGPRTRGALGGRSHQALRHSPGPALPAAIAGAVPGWGLHPAPDGRRRRRSDRGLRAMAGYRSRPGRGAEARGSLDRQRGPAPHGRGRLAGHLGGGAPGVSRRGLHRRIHGSHGDRLPGGRPADCGGRSSGGLSDRTARIFPHDRAASAYGRRVMAQLRFVLVLHDHQPEGKRLGGGAGRDRRLLADPTRTLDGVERGQEMTRRGPALAPARPLAVSSVGQRTLRFRAGTWGSRSTMGGQTP